MATEQPWLANPEWVNKRINGSAADSKDAGANASAWLACIFCFVMGGVGLALKGHELASQKSPSLLLLLFFPLVGVVLLWSNLSRARKYPNSYFEMQSVPFFVGQSVRGTIHGQVGTGFKTAVRVRLNCIRRTRSAKSGMGSKIGPVNFDELVWRQEKLVTPAPDSDPQWAVMPIDFEVPKDAPTTGSTGQAGTIRWSLEAQAKARGINFVRNFEIPVFSAEGNSVSSGSEERDLNRFSPISVSLPDQPSGAAQVVILPSTRGGLNFLFLANRHWGMARIASVAFCLWTAVIWYLLRGSESLALSIFILGDLLLLYWAIWSWFSTSSAVFESDGVTVRTSLLGIGSKKVIAYQDIRDITAPIARQSGQGSNAIPFYSINLNTSSQGDITVGGSVRDAGEAGFVVRRMKTELEKHRSPRQTLDVLEK